METIHISYFLFKLLTFWSRVLPEKLTGAHIVKKFFTFLIDREGSQAPTTCPYPESAESSPPAPSQPLM